MRITITKGDIFGWSADYIVNPANTHLRHGGGLARAIEHRATLYPACDPAKVNAAGRIEKWFEDNEGAPPVATGDAHLTSPGMLPYLGVIHAVGPIWKDGTLCEEDLLRSAHLHAIELAAKSPLVQGKILFPAISCGIFGFPVELAATQAILAVEDSEWITVDQNLELDVVFVLGSTEHFAAYVEAARRTRAEVQII